MEKNPKDELMWTHWSTENEREFFPSKRTISKIPSDYYKIKYNEDGFYVRRIEEANYSNETTSQVVKTLIDDVKSFWSLEKEYKKIKLTFSKGILIYGPPGNGKTLVSNLLVKEILSENGIAIEIEEPEDYIIFTSIIRKMEPRRKVILTIKNIDYMMDNFGFLPVIDMIDRMSKCSNLIYVATTSSLDRIDEILYNNSSSFDKKIKIESPKIDERREFIRDKVKELEMLEQNDNDEDNESKKGKNKINVDKWARDTEKFSYSNLKELVVSVILYNEDYEKKIKEISIINKKFEEKPMERKLGFRQL